MKSKSITKRKKKLLLIGLEIMELEFIGLYTGWPHNLENLESNNSGKKLGVWEILIKTWNLGNFEKKL